MKRQPEIKPKTVRKLNAWKRSIAPPNPYRPYIRVRHTTKVGRRHWTFCPKQKREAHLLSDGEFRTYKMLVWHPDTIEVMEQYALDIDETLSIAIAADIIHPRKWEEKEATVMTTDFVVRRRCQTSGEKWIAYTFKYWDSIFEYDENGKEKTKSVRTWQKFAIEREYWRRRDVEYRIITERDATKIQAWNVGYFETECNAQVCTSELKNFCKSFIRLWSDNPLLELQQILNLAATELKTSFQHSQTLFKVAGLHRLLPIDIDTSEIRLFRPVRLVLS